MPEIVLTPEQSEILSRSSAAVLIRDAAGTAVGLLDRNEAEVIAEAKRRLATATTGATRTGAELLNSLQCEWDRLGGMNGEQMQEFLRQRRAGECGG